MQTFSEFWDWPKHSADLCLHKVMICLVMSCCSYIHVTNSHIWPRSGRNFESFWTCLCLPVIRKKKEKQNKKKQHYVPLSFLVWGLWTLSVAVSSRALSHLCACLCSSATCPTECRSDPLSQWSSSDYQPWLRGVRFVTSCLFSTFHTKWYEWVTSPGPGNFGAKRSKKYWWQNSLNSHPKLALQCCCHFSVQFHSPPARRE